MERQLFSRLLGLDLGSVNTRASIMGVKDEKFRLLGCESARTSLGEGLNLGTGAGDAMRRLQKRSNHILLEKSGQLLMPSDSFGKGVDRVAMTTSVGPLPHTILLGLAKHGSLQAGRNLVDSLPLSLMSSYRMDVLVDQSQIITELVLQTYNVEEEKTWLKKDIDKFEEYRGNYPVRREFGAFEVRVENMEENEIRKLRKLGFKIRM